MARQTISLRLDPEAIAAVRSKNRKTIQEAIKAALLDGDHESTELAGFLQGFCTHTVETYAHESLIVDCVEDETPTCGKVSVSFVGDAYMGCKGADYLHDHEETLSYRKRPTGLVVE